MAQARATTPQSSRIGNAGSADQVFRAIVTGAGGLVIVILAGLIVLLIVVNILALQSPRNISTQVERPIDLFVTSVTEGGANLEIGEGEDEKPGAPQPGKPKPSKP